MSKKPDFKFYDTAYSKPHDRKERRRMRGILHKAAINGISSVSKADKSWYEMNRIRLVYGSVENYLNTTIFGPIRANKRTPWPYRVEC